MTYPTVSFDIRSLTPEVDSKYGAPMGRGSYGQIDPDGIEKYAATRIRFQDGDYDRGGAYWGGGRHPLYCVHSITTDDVRQFVRANSPDEAFDQLEVPLHLRVTVLESGLHFDCEGDTVDVSQILELFDSGSLYPEDFMGRNGRGREAEARAQVEVQDWVFTPGLYRLIRLWWHRLDSDHDGAEMPELDCRTLVLRYIASDYHTLLSYSDDCIDCDEYETPLDLLRGVEWSDDRECPIDCWPASTGLGIYYCFGE